MNNDIINNPPNGEEPSNSATGVPPTTEELLRDLAAEIRANRIEVQTLKDTVRRQGSQTSATPISPAPTADAGSSQSQNTLRNIKITHIFDGDRSKFKAWKSYITILMRGNSLLGYLTGDLPRPTTPEFCGDFDTKDAFVAGIILSGVAKEVAEILLGLSDTPVDEENQRISISHNYWRSLHAMYDAHGDTFAPFLTLSEIVERKCSDVSDVTKWVQFVDQRFTKLHEKLAEKPKEMLDMILLTIIMRTTD